MNKERKKKLKLLIADCCLSLCLLNLIKRNVKYSNTLLHNIA